MALALTNVKTQQDMQEEEKDDEDLHIGSYKDRCEELIVCGAKFDQAEGCLRHRASYIVRLLVLPSKRWYLIYRLRRDGRTSHPRKCPDDELNPGNWYHSKHANNNQ